MKSRTRLALLRSFRTLGESFDHMVYGVLVTLNTAANNDCLGLVREVGMMAPFLSRVDVGHMELDEGYANTQERVPDGN